MMFLIMWIARSECGHGPRSLFLFCVWLPTSIGLITTGFLFLRNLGTRLEYPEEGVSYDAILVPLMAGYVVVLACYLTMFVAFPRLLPRLLRPLPEDETPRLREQERTGASGPLPHLPHGAAAAAAQQPGQSQPRREGSFPFSHSPVNGPYLIHQPAL
jgi:hypothetical protein